jgi:hypothetical protein
MTGNAGNKYIATRALDWLGGVWSGFLSWLIDEERGFKRLSTIGSFILGAFVMRIAPGVFYYAGAAAGLLLFLAFVVSCLFPIALLIEWAFRKVSGR